MLPPQPWHWALGEGGSGVVAVGGWPHRSSVLEQTVVAGLEMWVQYL